MYNNFLQQPLVLSLSLSVLAIQKHTTDASLVLDYCNWLQLQRWLYSVPEVVLMYIPRDHDQTPLNSLGLINPASCLLAFFNADTTLVCAARPQEIDRFPRASTRPCP